MFLLTKLNATDYTQNLCLLKNRYIISNGARINFYMKNISRFSIHSVRGMWYTTLFMLLADISKDALTLILFFSSEYS